MSTLKIHQFPCLSDNYGVLIFDPETGMTASIDAPDAGAVRDALSEMGWSLTHILNTHHHHDHTGGNQALKQETGCTIAGPKNEAAKIPGIDITLAEGDEFEFGSFKARIFETPGHTLGHITYWFPGANVAFAGDTIFALGCGRVLEGTMQMMWNSLQKIMALPPETIIYCGHEYTLSNAKFALSVEPDNEALQKRTQEFQDLRDRGKPTVPTRLSDELATNPFLRPSDPAIRQRLGMEDSSDWEVFAEIRERKDRF